LARCLDLAITGGASALGLARPQIEPGAVADLIAFAAPNVPSAVVEHAVPDLVVREGVLVIDKRVS
jgi:cytosine deaminase